MAGSSPTSCSSPSAVRGSSAAAHGRTSTRSTRANGNAGGPEPRGSSPTSPTTRRGSFSPNSNVPPGGGGQTARHHPPSRGRLPRGLHSPPGAVQPGTGRNQAPQGEAQPGCGVGGAGPAGHVPEPIGPPWRAILGVLLPCPTARCCWNGRLTPKFPAPKFPAPKFPAPKFPAPKFPAPKFPAGKPSRCWTVAGASAPGPPVAWR